MLIFCSTFTFLSSSSMWFPLHIFLWEHFNWFGDLFSIWIPSQIDSCVEYPMVIITQSAAFGSGKEIVKIIDYY